MRRVRKWFHVKIGAIKDDKLQKRIFQSFEYMRVLIFIDYCTKNNIKGSKSLTLNFSARESFYINFYDFLFLWLFLWNVQATCKFDQ